MNQKVYDFDYWKKLHDTDNLQEFNTNSYGLLWLKIKSILRKELLQEFLESQNIQLSSKKADKKFIELYTLMCQEILLSHQKLDKFINKKSKEKIIGFDENKLVSELFKLRNFDWGGDYKNALDKHLVDRYIKVYLHMKSW